MAQPGDGAAPVGDVDWRHKEAQARYEIRQVLARWFDEELRSLTRQHAAPSAQQGAGLLTGSTGSGTTSSYRGSFSGSGVGRGVGVARGRNRNENGAAEAPEVRS